MPDPTHSGSCRRSPSKEPQRHPRSSNRPIKVACKTCHTKRVKCDADGRKPCRQCRIRQISCELIDSRRGRYPRKTPLLQQPASSLRPPPPVRSTGGETIPPVPLPISAADHTVAPSTSQSTSLEEESWSVSYVIDVVHASTGSGPAQAPSRVHYPIPASLIDRSFSTFGPRDAPCAGSPLEDCLVLPDPGVSDQLIRVFFEVIHPACPVLDREHFSRLYLQGQASPMVLQVIFFLGFTVCGDGLVRQSSFRGRAEARKTCYRRAKTLYDLDHDTDPFNVLAVLLLLGFWRAGSDEQKDSYHWVGCAASFAQSLGFHRSVQHGLSARSKALSRRIWWSIYIRDRHAAAAFGRPCRIYDGDCEIDRLAQADFEFDLNYDQRLIPPQEPYHILYMMEMAKLATIWGAVLMLELDPTCACWERDETVAQDRLARWESQLPGSLRLSPLTGALDASFWASMLNFNFQNCRILLYRSKAAGKASSGDVARHRRERERMAADAITRNAEDQLAAGTIRLGQIHLVPALFAALAIFTIIICRHRNDPIQRHLAENKSKQCLLALSEVSKTWPIRIWITKSFAGLMRRLTDRGPSASASASGETFLDISCSIVSQPAGASDGCDDQDEGICATTPAEMSGPAPDCVENSPPTTVALEQYWHDGSWASWLDGAFNIDSLGYPAASFL